MTNERMALIVGVAGFLLAAQLSASVVLAFVVGVLFSAALRDDGRTTPRRRQRPR
jgi:hypothetical protein